MNSVASVLREAPDLSGGQMDDYLGNMVDERHYGICEGYDYAGLTHTNSLTCDQLFMEREMPLSYDGSCYSDFSGSVYSGSCYGSNDNMYPDLGNSLYTANSFAKSEPDLGSYSMEHKFSMEANYVMESSEITTSSTSMQYLTPKIKPKYEYSMNSLGANAPSSLTSNMNANVGGLAVLNTMANMNPNMMDMVSPGRPTSLKKVSTHDLAMFNSVMDGTALTPIRSGSGNLMTNTTTMKTSSITSVTTSITSVTTASTVSYTNDINYPQYYPYDEKATASPFMRHPSASNQSLYGYDTEFSKSVDSLISFPSDRNVSSSTGSPGQDLYSSGERSVGGYGANGYNYSNMYQNCVYQTCPSDMDCKGHSYYMPTTVTTNVATTYTVKTFDPTMSHEDRYREILKTILAMPCMPETFLSPVNPQILKSTLITDLSKKYDDSQRAANPPETHIVYVRNNSDMNLVLRNDNMLVQHANHTRGEKLKLSKQILNSKNVATSGDLNDCIARSRNDEQGMSYLPYVSCNWKGVHETSWWMADEKGVVRNFKVNFDPMVFGSKSVAFDEATKFAKFVEGLIRPGTLIKWYPGFNIPIGTSGRANLRKVLHMDRMKNAELCDPVLEANGLKVAPKSTFGDMIIVELYKAAYVLGLWDVAAYNCLKTCKRRGYSFEWIHDIQSSGKRITLDALKYMRNVKEMIEQDKISRVNSEKRRRRRKMPDKRRRGN